MALQDIQATVSGLINRNTATPALITGWINQGFERIEEEMRVREMEKTLVYTRPDDGTEFTGIPVPTDYLELIDIQNTAGKRLEKEDLTRVTYLMRFGGAGVPQYYYRYGTNWLIGPRPHPGFPVGILYYAKLTRLANPTDTNQISEIYPSLCAYAALGFAADFFTDSRGPQWETRYTSLRDSITSTQEEDEASGASVMSPVWFWPSDLVAYGWSTGGSFSE